MFVMVDIILWQILHLVIACAAILSYSPKKVCKERRTGGRFRISPPCVPLIKTAKGAYRPHLIPRFRVNTILWSPPHNKC